MFTAILRFYCIYAIEMALKSQKRCTLQCCRASKNLEKSNQSGQNAGKSLILHVQFAVTTVAEKALKINPKWPKKNKNRPQDGFKTALPQNSSPPKWCLTSSLPPEPPTSPQVASKRAPRGLQEASKRPPEGPQGAANILKNQTKSLYNNSTQRQNYLINAQLYKLKNNKKTHTYHYN